MDESERLVEKYLNELGRGSVVFEPDGNIPPDFVLAGNVAVEVRRLNQNYELPNGEAEGLEQIAIPLWQKLRKLLPTLGPSTNGESWFIGMDFRRPLEPWKILESRVRQELLLFKNNPDRRSAILPISANFNLDVLRASADHGSFFLLGASSDDDSGGWVMGEVERNLKLCIAEKMTKTAPYRRRYAEWWLALSDHIDFSMELEDRAVFLAEVVPTLQHTFDKIILIDPRNHLRAFEF